MDQSAVLARLARGVIVSVQAAEGEPLYNDTCILAMAQSAVMGGARGLRVAGASHVGLMKSAMPEIPVIAITKPKVIPPNAHELVYITPTVSDVMSLIESGADIIAMDATLRTRPGGETLADLVQAAREASPSTLLMADIATAVEAQNADALGFDLISTTLSGYTIETLEKSKTDAPDYALLETLCQSLKTPVILEGRVWEPSQLKHGFDLGAYAAVVGSAITRPQLITRRFVEAI